MSDTRTTEELMLLGMRNIAMVTAQTLSLSDVDTLEDARYALDTLTSRLEALEAEHEAAYDIRSYHAYTEDSLDKDWVAAHDHAERVMKNG